MRGGHVDAASRTHVAGWAADSDHPHRPLELCILVDGAEYGRARANRPRPDIAALGRFGDAGHGFDYAFVPPLTPHADHSVAVHHADTMQLLPNGECTLPRDPAAPSPPPAAAAATDASRLTPVLVSAPGRSGTTYLMSCLADAPRIVAASLVPYEVRLLSYYATAFGVLTAPGDLEHSTHPDRLEGDGFHIGFNPFTAQQYADAFRDRSVLTEFQRDWLPERIGSALADAVREYYARLAADHGKAGAAMFAEKNNNLNEPTRRFVRRMFPGMREIVITRDPRDVLCSHVAYFSSSQEKAFNHLSHSCRQLLRMREAAGEDACFIRYEDMIQGHAATFARLSDFLGTAVTPAAGPASNAVFERHGTSETPQKSIGRWRHDLPDDMRTQSSTAWRAFLDRFGYAQA